MNRSEQPMAVACLHAALQGRDSASTGAPTDAQAAVGGEGTPAAQVPERKAPPAAASANGVIFEWNGHGRWPSLSLRRVDLWGDGLPVSIWPHPEGLFLGLRPWELAVLWPWVKL